MDEGWDDGRVNFLSAGKRRNAPLIRVIREGMRFVRGVLVTQDAWLQSGQKLGHPKTCWEANQQVGLRDMLVDYASGVSLRFRE